MDEQHEHDPLPPPADDHGILQACRRLMEVRRLDMAQEQLELYLGRHPEDPEGHALLAWCHALKGERQEAVEYAQEAVRLDPEWAYTHAMLGSVHLAFGWMRGAERAMRAALELEPENAGYHAILAESLLYQPFRARAAVRAAEAGLALDPENAICARVRARGLLALFRTREARRAMEYALRLAPESAETHAAAVDLEWAAGDVVRLREHLRAQLRLDAGNEQAQILLGMVLEFSRKAAAYLIAARGMARLLQWVAALYIAEVVAVLVLAEPNLPFLFGYSLLWVGMFGGPMLWVHLRHPDVVEEMRDPTSLRPQAWRNVSGLLKFLAVMMLAIPPLAIVFQRVL